jgi:ADP-ribosylglycohydrolase
VLWGAICGDILGSVYEGVECNKKCNVPCHIPLFNDTCRFTDDTVLTVAVAEALEYDFDIESSLKKWTHRYPRAGFAKRFLEWADGKGESRGAGNGAAMRISAVGWRAKTIGEVESLSRAVTSPSHDHYEAYMGARVVAHAIFRAREHAHKDTIRNEVEFITGYSLRRTLDEIRPSYTMNTTCALSVPEAFTAFFESNDYISAVQGAISIGGDSDTLAAIAGSIAEAYYGEVPEDIIKFARKKLTLELLDVIDAIEKGSSQLID